MAEAPTPEPRPYQRVYADLRGRIERGELAEGMQLPSQPTLAGEYGVALLTVRHAIDLLRRAGYVSVEHGRGTFVTDPRGGDTILVIDDDARVRSILVEHVSYAGFRVVEASNGQEALGVLERERISLVFTDLRMPVMDGVAFLRRARPRWPNTIFVVVSAYPDDLAGLYRMDAFPITVIPKPFRAEQVRRALGLLRTVDAPTRPAAPARPAPSAESAIPPADVLLVDEDAYHRALLSEMLVARGHRVREAGDGVSALESIAEERFTHLFLDLHLPGLGGLELARIIREQDARVSIVIMGSRPEDADEVKAAGLGLLTTLVKPLDTALVLAALRMGRADAVSG